MNRKRGQGSGNCAAIRIYRSASCGWSVTVALAVGSKLPVGGRAANRGPRGVASGGAGRRERAATVPRPSRPHAAQATSMPLRLALWARPIARDSEREGWSRDRSTVGSGRTGRARAVGRGHVSNGLGIAVKASGESTLAQTTDRYLGHQLSCAGPLGFRLHRVPNLVAAGGAQEYNSSTIAASR